MYVGIHIDFSISEKIGEALIAKIKILVLFCMKKFEDEVEITK